MNSSFHSEILIRVLLSRRQHSDDDDDIKTDSHRHNLPNSSQEHLFNAEREKSESYSGEKHTRRSRGNDLRAKYFDHNAHSLHDRHVKNPCSLTGTRDRKAYHGERSNSRAENMSKSSERYVNGRHDHRHHKITRNHYERRGHFGSDSDWNQRKGQEDKRRVYSDEKGFSKKHGSLFGSGEEPSSSRDQKKRQRDGDQSRSSKHSRDGTKYIQNELFCRSKMVRRDEDCGEDNYQPKRKRVY